ncbi:hypothetical protein EPD60_07480 [Flaviaesturariibacter flavus]|uniref:Uncharacterized protein n=1 Tax=Flaviaesturariibacter flavus TaxID=2502780 RepID=A0A4R1BHC1_9BACT|nr:hypothetical protein [Flaviaesturariibacter flavus]TCJ16574.1 hypothetical protein EPD60_07480 [Flaviaesturariibacter flavus]
MNLEKVNQSQNLPVEVFRTKLFDPLIPIDTLGIDRSVTAFWRREGLMPFMMNYQHARLSPVKAMWVMLLDVVRGLGLPTKRMRELAEYFLYRAESDNLPKLNIEHHINRMEEKARLVPLMVEELELLTEIKRTLADEAALEILRWDVNYFSNLVLESLTTGKQAGIQLYKDYIVEYVGDKYRTFPDRECDLGEPHINIPLHHLLNHFVVWEELDGFPGLYFFPSPDERKVLDAIADRRVKTITIKRGKKREPLIITTTEMKYLSSEESAKLREVLRLKNYESITLDTVDGKTVSFTKTKKKL